MARRQPRSDFTEDRHQEFLAFLKQVARDTPTTPAPRCTWRWTTARHLPRSVLLPD
jgi:hypothetical protein